MEIENVFTYCLYENSLIIILIIGLFIYCPKYFDLTDTANGKSRLLLNTDIIDGVVTNVIVAITRNIPDIISLVIIVSLFVRTLTLDILAPISLRNCLTIMAILTWYEIYGKRPNYIVHIRYIF